MPKTTKRPSRYTFPVNLTEADRDLMERVHGQYESVSRHAIVRAAIRYALLQELEEPGLLARCLTAAATAAAAAKYKLAEPAKEEPQPEPAKPLTEAERIELDMAELGVGDPDVANPFPVD